MAQQQHVEVTVTNKSKFEVLIRILSEQSQILENSALNQWSNEQSSTMQNKTDVDGQCIYGSVNVHNNYQQSNSSKASSTNATASRIQYNGFLKSGWIPVFPNKSRTFAVQKVPFSVSWHAAKSEEFGYKGSHCEHWNTTYTDLIFDGYSVNKAPKAKKYQYDVCPANGTYKIKACNKVFDVSGGSHANCAKVLTWPSHNGDNQKFRIKKQSNGYFTIQCVKSSKYLDVTGSSTANGAEVIQFEYHGGDNQLFKFEKRGKTNWSIRAKHSGKVLDVNGNGYVVQWKYHGEGNQLFSLKKV